MRGLVVCAAIALTACGGAPTETASAAYFERLTQLCDGNAYAGRLVSTDEADADFRDAEMTIGSATCTGLMVRVPFRVGEDRSRTWEITRTTDGIRLKHDHRHRDGTEDVLTQYGGDSLPTGTSALHEFPADEDTKALFIREDIEVSTQNTWAIEIEPDQVFAYQMSRPNRLFRVEFDLSDPTDLPPPPWGEVPVE
ncbi:MAG: hypothetical protein HRT81_16285 [Henriciella sp.]|nr:hypothetical protein [Henriciella sp.]